MTWLRIIYSILITGIFCNVLNAQVYTVNTDDDIDNGVCTVLHCSLREAINASEKDGVSSTIVFNIPGAGQHQIVPLKPLPDITQPDLNIKGETQSGIPGNITIDLNYQDFGRSGFWNILGNRFQLSGINFRHLLFSKPSDQLLKFGNSMINTMDCQIHYCAFYEDSLLANADTVRKLINVFNADNMHISNCYFGTDQGKSKVYHLESGIYIDVFQWLKKTKIDSNIFLNTRCGLFGFGGELDVSNNFFGTLDSVNKNTTYYSDIGFWGRNVDFGRIENNYFYGCKSTAILFESCSGEIHIDNNAIYNCPLISIYIYYNSDNKVYIRDNIANHSTNFLYGNGNYGVDFTVERNNCNDFDYFIYEPSSHIFYIRYINNIMTCFRDHGWTPVNVFSRTFLRIEIANDTLITGSGTKVGDSIVVYFNPLSSCSSGCAGGYELGRTQIDGNKNWVLHTGMPSNAHISAYEFNGDLGAYPNVYSKFSCYDCKSFIRKELNPKICNGDSWIFNGVEFNAFHQLDSFLITADDGHFCDTMYVIDLYVKPNYLTRIDTTLCFNDTLQFGSIAIYQGHLSDSIILQSATGCDSTVTINAVVIGTGKFNRIICENDTLRIGSTLFNKNHLSGLAVIKGGSTIGCDSIVDVNLSIDNNKSIELPNDITVHKGNPIVLNPEVNFIPSSIIWSPNLYLDCDTCLNPISKPESNITYHLTATDGNGCTVTDQFTITVFVDNAEIFVPNAFSPNGDNINDIFEPVFKFPNSTAIREFRIFDRWGDQVYERRNGVIGEIFGWDGTANGEKMNPGVYVYTIQFVGDDGILKWKTGDIILIR